jgi:hypothetical protein
MDIIITENDFQTFANVIIVNLTCLDMVQHGSTMTTHASTIVAKDKAQSYTK